MKKSLLMIFTGLVLPVLAPRALAQTPMDYYRAGVVEQLLSTGYYIQQYVGPQMSAMFADRRQYWVRAGAPPEVLAFYDRMVSAAMTLPFRKSFQHWTPAELAAWEKVRFIPNGWILNKWLGMPPSPANLYFWLGAVTTYMAQIGPADLNAWHTRLSDLQSDYQTYLRSYVVVAQDSAVMATLKPQVRAAVIELAQDSQALDWGMAHGRGPITRGGVNSVARAAGIIAAAAANGGSVTQ